MIPELRRQFNRQFRDESYTSLLALLEQRWGVKVEFRVAETPIFVPRQMLEEMAAAGVDLAQRLMANDSYVATARAAIPPGYQVPAETSHPHFLTADFSLIRDAAGQLRPMLVEIQAFPSVYGYQSELCRAYRDVFQFGDNLGVFLGGLDEEIRY